MRRWLLRTVITIWFVLYAIIHVPLLVPLVAVWGVWLTALAGAVVIGIWGTVFYFLLLRESGFERARKYLSHFQSGGERGLVAWARNKFFKNHEEEVLLSPFWILASFIVLGALGGVFTIRLAYPRNGIVKALLLVWVGCILNAFFLVVVVYGPPAAFARRLVLGFIGRS